jgi:ribosomal protein S27E
MTLDLTCPECDGEGTVLTSHHGGNDPNTWYIACQTCGGVGERRILCDGFRCDAPATEAVIFPTGETEHYCDACAAVVRADLALDDDDLTERGFGT